jgi:hypothetical protein
MITTPNYVKVFYRDEVSCAVYDSTDTVVALFSGEHFAHAYLDAIERNEHEHNTPKTTVVIVESDPYCGNCGATMGKWKGPILSDGESLLECGEVQMLYMFEVTKSALQPVAQ